MKKPEIVFLNTKYNTDLFHLIVLNEKKVDTSFSLKFSFIGNEFLVNYCSSKPHAYTTTVTSNEITYHSSDQDHPKPIIHIKEKEIEFPYTKISQNIADLARSVFPIPICRIQFGDNDCKKYIQKKNHYRFDISDDSLSPMNGIEIYIAKKGFSESKFMYKWPNMHFLWLISDIDYLNKGITISNQFAEAMSKGPKTTMKSFQSFENIEVIFKFCIRKGDTRNSITFFDNIDYLTILGATLVNLNKQINEPLSPYPRAYELDQDWQENLLGIYDNRDLFAYLRDKISETPDLNRNNFVYCPDLVDSTTDDNLII